ncbi:MAG: peptidoglycan-binding protein [Planctomycetota bacterium]|jgi:D-alanyl-D-alanine carboxypeptidase
MRTNLVLFIGFWLFVLVASQAQGSTPWITAPSAAVATRDGKTLWSKGPGYKAPPASTAKVMASLVALERAHRDTWTTISAKAASQEPTRIGVRKGEKYRIGDLVRASLIKSGNDAACALAEAVAGSEATFARWMTEKARALGARSTVFKRASGLPAKGAVTTATDLVLIMRAALKVPFIVKVMSIRETWIESASGRRIRLRNHNRLLWDDRYPVYLKTGYTRASKHCYVGFIGSKGEIGVFAFLSAKKPWPDSRAIASWCRKGGAKIAWNRKNLSTDQVLSVQGKLKSRHFDPGPVDGIFGPKTLRAVKAFQKAAKLPDDGLVGPKTLLKLGLKSK